MTEQQPTLGSILDRLKAVLSGSGRGGLARAIDEAMRYGSTSLEIHYRLLGTLQQMRPELRSDAQAEELASAAIAYIERAVSRNA